MQLLKLISRVLDFVNLKKKQMSMLLTQLSGLSLLFETTGFGISEFHSLDELHSPKEWKNSASSLATSEENSKHFHCATSLDSTESTQLTFFRIC